MKFTSMKQTLISITVFLTILFLGSCAEEITAPPGGPQPDYMSFALTNLGGGPPVDPTTPLSRGDNYRLIITPTNGTTIPTADYTITHIPTAAITRIAASTNSVDFTINNTTDTSVTFTVAHRTASAVSETITLTLAPLAADYMSFALTNLGGGAPVDPTTSLSRGDTYRLTITPASGTTIPTADYTINHIPTDAIIIDVTRTNSVDFTVNNTADTRVTVTVTHRTNSAVSESISLNLAPQADYMSFALTNLGGGPLVTPTTQLSVGDGYRLMITRASGTTTPTADYTIGYIPVGALIIDTRRSNSIDFTIDNTPAASITFTVTHRTNSAVSESITFNIAGDGAVGPPGIQSDIMGSTVPNLATANALTREVLTPLRATASATLEKRYVTESGGGSYNGSSWTDAWAATNLRNGIENITDATANKVYLVMVAGGTYNPSYVGAGIGNPNDLFRMRDYVAIMGGFQTGGGWARTGTTILSGDIGTVGDNRDNANHVFANNDGVSTYRNSHLYGVVITGGTASGAGMINVGASPNLTKVIFSNNNSLFADGGGLYNVNSSPVLTSVVFSGNTANGNGGGMYNQNSSPVLINVVFSGNTASGTRATSGGGGMYNASSSPVIIGAVFTNNRAANGGGVFNNNGGQPGPLIVNTIFSANTLIGSGSGSDIAVDRSGTGTENIRIAGSVLGIGQSSAIAGIVSYNGTATVNTTYHSLDNTAVNFGADATIGGLTYPTITGGSAVNLGLYVWKHVNGAAITYYFSETGTGTSWHTGFTSAGGLAGTAVILPTTGGTIENLTATDIAGNARNVRPDAGVHELP